MLVKFLKFVTLFASLAAVVVFFAYLAPANNSNMMVSNSNNKYVHRAEYALQNLVKTYSFGNQPVLVEVDEFGYCEVD